MTDEKAKEILKAINEGNRWKAMQEMPEGVQCEEVYFLIGLLVDQTAKINRIRDQINAINFEN